MNDIPLILSSRERLLLRLGTASYGPTDGPHARRTACVRAAALALGTLARSTDVDGTVAEVAADTVTINLTMNEEVTAIRKLGQDPTQYTVGETNAALAILREMGVLHATARAIGPWRVEVLTVRALVSRIDPAVDGALPDLPQTESET